MMMLGPDKKKIVQVIVEKLHKQDATPPGEGEKVDYSGKEAAAEKLIACIRADDPKGCAAALSEFLAMSGMEAEDSEEEQGESEGV